MILSSSYHLRPYWKCRSLPASTCTTGLVRTGSVWSKGTIWASAAPKRNGKRFMTEMLCQYQDCECSPEIYVCSCTQSCLNVERMIYNSVIQAYARLMFTVLCNQSRQGRLLSKTPRSCFQFTFYSYVSCDIMLIQPEILVHYRPTRCTQVIQTTIALAISRCVLLFHLKRLPGALLTILTRTTTFE